MLDIDVDEIREITWPENPHSGKPSSVRVVFKDGSERVFQGAELGEALAILKHWTPPTA